MLELQLGRLKVHPGAQLKFVLTAVCDPAAYGYPDLELAAPLVLNGQAENRGTDICVTGDLQASLALVCSRCGKNFQQALKLPFTGVYSWQAELLDAEGEQDIYLFEGETIDLTPEALRQIFLELPMKPLCREDCQGLCPHCGVDLNTEQCACAAEEIDPRWQKLKALLDEQSKGV